MMTGFHLPPINSSVAVTGHLISSCFFFGLPFCYHFFASYQKGNKETILEL